MTKVAFLVGQIVRRSPGARAHILLEICEESQVICLSALVERNSKNTSQSTTHNALDAEKNVDLIVFHKEQTYMS